MAETLIIAKVDCLDNLLNLAEENSNCSENPWFWDGKGGRNTRNAQLLETGFLSDLTLYVGKEKEEIRVHRFFLQVASPVFHKIFEKHPQMDKMEIPDIDCSEFKMLLQYLYSCSNSNQIKMEHAQPLLAIASKFQVEDLAQVCATTLKGELTDNNVLKLLQQGMDYGNKDLVESSLQYFSKKAWKIIDQEEFMGLSRDCIFEIVQRDDLSVLSEIQLFNALMKWGNAECERKGIDPTSLTTSGETNLRVELNRLIPLIRFPLMDETDFIETVLPKAILTMEEGFSIMCMQRIPSARRANLYDITGTGKFSAKPRKYYKPVQYSVNRFTGSSNIVKSPKNFEILNIKVNRNVSLIGIKLIQTIFMVFAQKKRSSSNFKECFAPNDFGWDMFKANLIICETTGTQEILFECEVKQFLPLTSKEILFGAGIKLQAETEYRVDLRFSGSLVNIKEQTVLAPGQYWLSGATDCVPEACIIVNDGTSELEEVIFSFSVLEDGHFAIDQGQGLISGFLFEWY